MALHAILAREIDAYLAGLVESLPELNSYALVDVGQIPEMRDTYLDRMEIPHAKLFAGTKEHKIAKYGPMLIPLDSKANSSQLPVSQLLHGMQYGWTVSWLTSPLGLEELARHLAGHFNGVFDDGREVLIRYYDPRNLAPFLRSIDANTKTGLLTPIKHWSYWDRDLVLQTISGLGLTDVVDIHNTHIARITQEGMAHAAIPDLIMSKLLIDSDFNAFDDWLPHTLYRAIAELTAEARQYGVQNFADIYLFISLALTVHQEFHRIIPLFITEQKNIKDGKTKLTDLVLEVDDDEWNNASDDGERLRNIRHQKFYKELISKKTDRILI
jgi:hypothetical protein